MIGIIAKAVEAKFRAEMTDIKEQVEKKVMECEMHEISISEVFGSVSVEEAQKFGADLKKEIIYWGQFDIGISEITKEYAKNNSEAILNEFNTEGIIENLYYVDKKTAGGKEKYYLYDSKENIVYKIPTTKIGKYIVHSIEELDDIRGVVKEDVVADLSQMVQEYEGISHYEPDLTGFVLDKTSIIYYERVETTNDAGETEITVGESISISAKEYINNGKQRTIQQNGKTYEFYNYNSKVWANILVENSGMKTYWVWIPRYSYSINKTEHTTSVKFIDLDSTPEDGYELHSDFADGKKGIWVSKYEPTETANIQVSNFPYYLPDMTGFNPENTYVEVYNAETESFEETKLKDIDDIQKFAKENNWFNYNEQVWGNIRVYEPESKTETWWVWIPRYAYNITGNSTSIKFIDLNNNPLDGTALPSNYVVHSAFGDDLKGIWVSKYEPVLKVGEVGATNNVNEPDMSGFNVDNTYIQCYNEDSKTFTEQTLRSILSDDAVINDNNVVEVVDIDQSKINGTWYSYDKKIWANIKVYEPESKTESWWVWIPRYAYNITGVETTIIWLDENGNPRDGKTLPSNYVPHSVFENATKGIWASKYEPSNK